MDIEQLTKRVQWIEDERRKERDTIALLDSRMNELEGALKGLTEQSRELSGEISRQAAIVTRMDTYDANLVLLRSETRQWVEESEKETRRHEEEAQKVRQVETRALETSIADIKKQLETLPKFERNLQVRVEEENRLRRLIEETQQRIESLKRDEEEYTRTYRLLEDGRRQDNKRIIDLQGEVMALRKRADDQRGQSELHNTNLRKLETRLNELVAVEAERRDSIASFLDKQALVQVERDRTWKDWESRFTKIEAQAEEVEAKLLTLDATQRDAKRAQGVLEELSARVDRRMNELTEIQRLAEDRFRQEWATFKADDQKRWTNYTLTQEEQRHDMTRQMERMNDRTTQIEDILQDLELAVEQANAEAGKRLQSMLAMLHEWVNAYEKVVARTR
jgi:chromosome segregation ATPase